MKNYAFVEGKKIKSARFHWNLGFSLKNGTKPEKIKKTLNYLNSYVEFLVENSIDKAYEPTIGYITEEGDKSVSFERRVVKLAYRIGLKNFNKIDGLDENFVDGFARASLALKFHDNV
jgi:hypothetical protein